MMERLASTSSSRCRVLHVFYSLTTGGTERLIADLVVGLTGPHFRVSVATFRGGTFADEIQRAGGNITVFGAPEAYPRVSRMLLHLRRLRSILSSELDIVHTHSLGILWRVLAASSPRRSWRWVHTEHTRLDVPGFYPPWLLRFAPMLLHRPDAVTGVTPSICDYYLNAARIASTKVHHVANGVDLGRFDATADRRATRRSLGIPDDAWLIGTVANLRPEKNHKDLVEALVHVRAHVPSVRLVFAGEGPLLPVLQHHARQLGVASLVHFLGARTDVPQILGALDTFCLPSRFEGASISMLEAMAAGCPVVATRVPGIVELIQDGRTGLLAPVADPRALASRLLHVHDDALMRAVLIDAARRHVATHATHARMLHRYADLYRGILRSQ